MNIRKTLFWCHLITGCLAGSIVLIMSITGILLAYERQIMNWVDRGARSLPPTPGASRLPMDAMLAQVTSQNTGTPSAVTLRSDTAAPAEVSFGRDHVFLVDASLRTPFSAHSTGSL
jgi:uncharacterized iron-regulated membrane protein